MGHTTLDWLWQLLSRRARAKEMEGETGIVLGVVSLDTSARFVPVRIKEGPPGKGYVQDAKRVPTGDMTGDPRQTWRGDLCRRETGSGPRSGAPKPRCTEP